MFVSSGVGSEMLWAGQVTISLEKTGVGAGLVEIVACLNGLACLFLLGSLGR